MNSQTSPQGVSESRDPGMRLRIKQLKVRFQAGAKQIHAVNGVDLSLGAGKTLALIGESGSGKSVTLRSILRLHPPRSTLIEGSIRVGEQEVLELGPAALANFRGAVASMIFQEPLLALDPVYSVGEQIVETMTRHGLCSTAEAWKKAIDLFERVRIPSPERRVHAYPHEMSGGMRQRAMIALALSCNPSLLLADEPTTALDATVQIQILLLLRELQAAMNLSIIFVTHDIGAAVEVADEIAVMYAGRIVEQGSAKQLMRSPKHPYTYALLMSRAHGSLKKGERLPQSAARHPIFRDFQKVAPLPNDASEQGMLVWKANPRLKSIRANRFDASSLSKNTSRPKSKSNIAIAVQGTQAKPCTMRLLVINPNTTASMTAAIEAVAKKLPTQAAR